MLWQIQLFCLLSLAKPQKFKSGKVSFMTGNKIYEYFSCLLCVIISPTLLKRERRPELLEIKEGIQHTSVPVSKIRSGALAQAIKLDSNIIIAFGLFSPMLNVFLAMILSTVFDPEPHGIATFIFFQWIYPFQFLCMSLFIYLRYKAFRLERKEKRFLESHAEEFIYRPADKPTNLGMICSSIVGLIIGCLIVLFSLYTDGFI